MSLLQIWVEPDHARVAVDTVGLSSITGQQRDMCKLFPLPHAGVVLAFRGVDIGFFQVFGQCVLVGADNFDGLVDAMPQHIADASTRVPPGIDPAALACELHIVGYSERAGRMAGATFQVELDGSRCDPRHMTGPCRLGPGFNDSPHLGSDAAMLATARRQLAWIREHEPERATGGQLLVAEVTRGGISTRVAGEIG